MLEIFHVIANVQSEKNQNRIPIAITGGKIYDNIPEKNGSKGVSSRLSTWTQFIELEPPTVKHSHRMYCS